MAPRAILLRGVCISALLLGVAVNLAWAQPAQYHVRLLQVAPPKLVIKATFQIDGRALEMDTTRPGDIPEINAQGWPALVSRLRVSDAAGKSLQVMSAAEVGWLLEQPHSGPLTVEYEVDYSSLAARGWPAPRETAFADADHFVAVGRSLFMTTQQAGAIEVTFELPPGWQAVAPWEQGTRSAYVFTVGSFRDLRENLLVFSRSEPDVVTAGGFRRLRSRYGRRLSRKIEHRTTSPTFSLLDASLAQVYG